MPPSQQPQFIGPPPTSLFLAVGVANALVFLLVASVARWLWRTVRGCIETLVWPAPALDVKPESEGRVGAG
jgi:hypothetical protein